MREVISSSFHDFLASRLPKTKTPNQKHGHVFEAILQLVPETGTPHHTTPTPLKRRNSGIFFFIEAVFWCAFFPLLPYCLSQKRKSYTPRKLIWNLINGFQKEYPFPRNPPPFSDSSRSFFGRLLAAFDFVGNLHPPENAPYSGVKRLQPSRFTSKTMSRMRSAAPQTLGAWITHLS